MTELRTTGIIVDGVNIGGRPPKPESVKRTTYVATHLTEAEKAVLKLIAKENNETMSECIRKSLLLRFPEMDIDSTTNKRPSLED